jgi:hypothetical protein
VHHCWNLDELGDAPQIVLILHAGH